MLTPVIQRGPNPCQKEARKAGTQRAGTEWEVEGQPREGGVGRGRGQRHRSLYSPPKQFSQGYSPDDHSALHLVSATPAAHLAPPGSFPPGPAQRQKASNWETSRWAGPEQVALARSWRELRDTGPLSPPHSLPARRFTLIRDALDETGNRRAVLS